MSFLADGLGSTVQLADSNQNLTTSYTYEPFGKATSSGPTNANPFQFTGRENDPAMLPTTSLWYFRNRYYSPQLGRFISPDPLGYGGGDMNLYAYGHNSPANFTDRLGLSSGPGPSGAPPGPKACSTCSRSHLGWGWGPPGGSQAGSGGNGSSGTGGTGGPDSVAGDSGGSGYEGVGATAEYGNQGADALASASAELASTGFGSLVAIGEGGISPAGPGAVAGSAGGAAGPPVRELLQAEFVARVFLDLMAGGLGAGLTAAEFSSNPYAFGVGFAIGFAATAVAIGVEAYMSGQENAGHSGLPH